MLFSVTLIGLQYVLSALCPVTLLVLRPLGSMRFPGSACACQSPPAGVFGPLGGLPIRGHRRRRRRRRHGLSIRGHRRHHRRRRFRGT